MQERERPDLEQVREALTEHDRRREQEPGSGDDEEPRTRPEGDDGEGREGGREDA